MSSTSHLPSSGEARPSSGEALLRSPSPSDDDVLIRVEGVSKIFCRDFKKSLKYGLMDSAKDLLSSGRKTKSAKGKGEGVRDLRKREFYAVKDVSFEVRRGECLGLIGHNGAGKTTLLKMLNGLIKPDSGRIEMRGRVGALIALGAGFNPLLTGKENIYVNGSVLGLSRQEIDEKMDEIIDFSEISEFIDSPVQTYSSGMQVRLGFSIATAMDPNILILDEVLAVGDFAFRQKCLRKVEEMMGECAVVFVSHNIEQVERICSHAVLMDRGCSIITGSVTEAARVYQNSSGDSDGSIWTAEGIDLETVENDVKIRFKNNTLNLFFAFNSDLEVADLCYRVRFRNQSGEYVAEYHSLNHGEVIQIKKGRNVIEVVIPEIPLKKGKYLGDFFIGSNSNDMIKMIEVKSYFTVEFSGKLHGFNSVQL